MKLPWSSCLDLTRGDVVIHACFRFRRLREVWVVTPHGPQRLPDAVLELDALTTILQAESWDEVVQLARQIEEAKSG